MSAALIAVVGLKREAAAVGSAGVVCVAGGGDADGLRTKLAQALRASPARAIVSVGIGGALAAELNVGDWVVADRIVGAAQAWESDPTLVVQLCAGLASRVRPLTLPTPLSGVGPFPLPQGEREKGGAALAHLPLRQREGARGSKTRGKGEGSRHPGRVFTGAIAAGDVMVVDAAAKAALYTTTGALAVDMESHVAAAFAAEHGLPFVALRVISDGADRALPKAAQAGMKKDGGIDVPAVLWSLVKDPRQLPALIQTGREAEVAFAKLALLGRHDLLGRLGVGDLDLGQLALDVV